MASLANSTSFGAINGNRPGRLVGDPTNTGRPPDTMRARFKLLLEREKVMKEAQRVLEDGDHRHFTKMMEIALDRAEGKVVQGVDLTSGGKTVPGVVILPAQDPVPSLTDPNLAQLPATTTDDK